MGQMFTTGKIAKKNGVSRAQVDYAIEKARISERARAGIIRLFSSDQIPAIEAAIASIRVRIEHA